MSEIWLLGAGFSKAVSAEMPTLTELGPDVVQAMGAPSETLDPFQGNLESFLSYIAEPQPWLKESQNTHNRALFLEATEAVNTVITARELKARQAKPQLWLTRLMMHWCFHAASVITFNYDLLSERATIAAKLVSSLTHIYAMPLEARELPGFLAPNPPRVGVYRLFKLHGSVNWGYGGIDAPPSARIALLPTPAGWSVDDMEQSTDSDLAYSDLVPLIIPPTASKSLFYGNSSLRGQWYHAAQQLARADRVFIVGYSLPPTDLASRHFLANNIAPGASVTVVDRSSKPGAAVQELLQDRNAVTRLEGENALSDLVESECGSLLEWGVDNAVGGWQPIVTFDGSPDPRVPKIPRGRWDPIDGSQSAQSWVDSFVNENWPGAGGSRLWPLDTLRLQYAMGSAFVEDGVVR